MTNKILVWGAMPWEQDGGAVVTYYQFQEMNYMNPMFEIHAIPKIWEQISQKSIPMVHFHKVKTEYFGQIPNEIPKIMKNNGISSLILWHIPWEYFPIIDKIHRIGGKVINWQTVHWKNDMLFLSDRLKDFDWWVPPTEYANQVIQEVAGLSNNLTVIPHGVNTQLFFPHKTDINNKGLKTILFTGRCQLTKGIVPLMMIARKFVDRFNCRIIFKAGVHEGVYKSKEIGHLLTQMSQRDSRILFIPQWTSPAFHEDLIASSDIIVCPSGHEGFSLTPLEGMACSKPVVVSDIPVHRELIGGRNGECGLLLPTSIPTEYVNDTQIVKVPDADMLYGSLKYLLENPDESEHMGEVGLKRAREVYDLRKICCKWFDLLEKF